MGRLIDHRAMNETRIGEQRRMDDKYDGYAYTVKI